ncbi:unnamed protein product [Polarella glacialis]|uniref:Glycoside hydrolase family 5 domain-containing protein n=1 Tax=Polarella glacialis TaxID=89957 RepID=A0A813IMV8_POLGL|nr:unnamed protein product [Polarella glacialis]
MASEAMASTPAKAKPKEDNENQLLSEQQEEENSAFCFHSPQPQAPMVASPQAYTENSCEQSSASSGAGFSGTWRGVSLGGWLLLEPGPSWPLFRRFAHEPPPQETEGQAVQVLAAGETSGAASQAQLEPMRCEWDLMRRLRRWGPEGLAALQEHRETFITRADFQRIAAAGLNAVRVPFGYWIVLGSTGRRRRAMRRTQGGRGAQPKGAHRSKASGRVVAAPATPARRSSTGGSPAPKPGRASIGAASTQRLSLGSERALPCPSAARRQATRGSRASLKLQRRRQQSRPCLSALVEKDPYAGPALEYVDRAVAWAEEFGLQVLLDLHGAPGGESAEAPSGRRQRLPGSRWKWRQWRFEESLRALRIVARRYRGSKAVTGIAVCNEPSPEVPTRVLCRFYDRAVTAVRRAGLRASAATVVLPVFQRSLPRFVEEWESMTRGVHENICFEVHWYHCFENAWHGRTFAQHLRAVQENAEELRRYPIVVGEWSLALGCAAQPSCSFSKDDMLTLFGHAQLAAYREASHGWFFWSWSDHPNGAEWDWQQAAEKRLLPSGDSLRSELPALPALPPLPSPSAARDAQSPLPVAATPQSSRRSSKRPLREPPRDPETAAVPKDPLEAVFDAPAADTHVRLGDTIYLRAFNGRYLDVEGPHVRARYGDRGRWQQLLLCPYLGEGRQTSGGGDGQTQSSGSGAQASSIVSRGSRDHIPGFEARVLHDGDIVCLMAHTGHYLGVSGRLRRQVTANWSAADSAACAFVVRTAGSSCEVRHRSGVFLQNLATSKVLAPNEGAAVAHDAVLARWKSFGEWQKLVVEKPLRTAVTPHRPRRRTSLPSAVPAVPAVPATPRRRRRASVGGVAASPAPSWATPATPSRKRCSIGSGLEAALAQLATPTRRRRSLASEALEGEAQSEPEADLKESLSAPTTPSRKRRDSLGGC